jgi:hypothetical protein
VGEVNVVMAREPIPAGPSVFLAGPTPERGSGVLSWRTAAVEELAEQWPRLEPLTVVSPESRGGVRARRYEDQVDWEIKARHHATVILFWIPRDMASMPGMTTNVEYGYDVACGRNVVLGVPADCPNPERNRYLRRLAELEGVPICATLQQAAGVAVHLLINPNA